MSSSYFHRAVAQSRRNPCLSDLCEFLQQPIRAHNQSRTVCIDIFEQPVPVTQREIFAKDFGDELRRPLNQPELLALDHGGRILIIEDVSKPALEELGSFFDIDPWFFASYVHRTWRKTSTPSPVSCSLPSREKKQNFLSLHYHRIVALQQKDTSLRSVTRNTNQQRKAVILPSLGGERIGLVQHSAAVMLVDPPGSFGPVPIILVDPPIKNNYIPSKRNNRLPPNLDSKSFLGGCEDFSDIAVPVTPRDTGNHHHVAQASDRAMLDELVYYWTHQRPQGFDASAPSLQHLSYYPLKIVAAEWVNYIAVLGLSLREYELSTSLTGNLVAELESLNTNLRILQGWRRRILSTQAKLQRNMRFIRTRSDSSSTEDWKDLFEDYEFLATEVASYGEKLEAMVPLVTSAAALIESRRALTETANVTRLTALAVIFVPLSYVAALFSMADSFAPGGQLFWVYFVTAVPLAVGVGVVAKVDVVVVVRTFWEWARRWMRLYGSRIVSL
ncbi:hypothetical protein E8E13_007512 [Curvularia kusanoi]|uniref:Uncharacterized protein n=1 Tax=Curvularia kusanoi TaxID=90978 RepID=A0A9P4TFE3_CURKU|nr:hypothetical protein E8E13_007512 [Curvularia kusanoi]